MAARSTAQLSAVTGGSVPRGCGGSLSPGPPIAHVAWPALFAGSLVGRAVGSLLVDGQVTLRPVIEPDLSWLAGLRNGPAATGPYEWHGWRDPESARRRWAESGLLSDSGGTLIVLCGGERIGAVSWRRVQTGPVAHSWAIGIGLVPDCRSRGYGSEAQRLLVRYLFAHTQVNRVEAVTEIANIGEQRALEKAGFTREGILRGSTFRQGRWHDQVIYSVLRNEINLGDSATEDAT